MDISTQVVLQEALNVLPLHQSGQVMFWHSAKSQDYLHSRVTEHSWYGATHQHVDHIAANINCIELWRSVQQLSMHLLVVHCKTA